MLYLWKATVRGVIFKMRAISFIVWPSANSCSTSRARAQLAGPLFPARAPGGSYPTRPCVASGVTYERPWDTSWMAWSNSEAAEFLSR